MSYINDNNLDDLFKRASDKYPLRTDSADWDRLVADLEREPSLILPPAKDADNRRRRRFLWLLLLLPLAGIGYFVIHPGNSHPGKNDVINAGNSKGTISQKAISEAGHSSMGGGDASNNGIASNNTDGKKSTDGKNSTDGKSDNQTASASLKRAQAATTNLADGMAPEKTNAAAINHSGNAVAMEADRTGSDRTRLKGDNKEGISGTNQVGVSGSNQVGESGSNQVGVSGSNQAEVSGSNLVGMTGTNHSRSALSDNQIKSRSGDLNTTNTSAITAGKFNNKGNAVWIPRDAEGSLVSLKTVPTAGGISLNIPVSARNKNIQATDTTKPTAKRKKDRQSSMYIGLIVAPDLSTVKLQSIKGTGITAGILLGYNFNRRWAMETGVYLDRKKYYSSGEYFNTKNIHLPPGYSLLNVDGSCNMLEIPVNVRYNLNSGPKMKWFATTGLSTYCMSREAYNYATEYSGQTGSYFGAYPNRSQYWFSIINLSVGFEQKLGKIGQLRLEPYWRIPTTGMGKGSLPIMSAGLNIGITHKLW